MQQDWQPKSIADMVITWVMRTHTRAHTHTCPHRDALFYTDMLMLYVSRCNWRILGAQDRRRRGATSVQACSHVPSAEGSARPCF